MMYLTTLLVFGGVLNCVFSLILNIEPKKIHVRPNDTIIIMCKTDSPISGCQFAWKNHLLQGPIMDFSLGPESPLTNPVGIGTDINSYSYTGSGLDNGECGLNITISRWGSRIIGCRVRRSTGGWVYADVGVQIDNQPSFPLVAVPNEVVVRKGDNVNIACIANKALKDCTISVPGIFLGRFNRGKESDETPEMKYYGTGLLEGQCGVSLLRVTDQFNGRLICAVKPRNDVGYELSTIAVIVAKAPTVVELNINKNPVPNGEQLQASCTVRDSRPVPTITWYLGAEKIRQDNEDDSPPTKDWEWKNLTRTIAQTITKPVTSNDNGKELRCEAEHVALSNRLVQSRVVSVEVPPMCRALKASSLVIRCVLGDYKTSCTEPSPAGTIATLQCKAGYLVSKPHPGYSSVTCSDTGQWSKPIYECVLDCGKRNIKGGDALISNGDTAYVGEFPWHVAIYQMVGSSIIHICGGTLIKPNLVVSAAHCFWSNSMGGNHNVSTFKIAAGKHYREWDKPETVPPQRRDVVEVYTHYQYSGRQGNFASDIAMIVLSSPVVITNYVNVICIDWDNERDAYSLSDGTNGTVPGWGFTETGEQSDELKVVNLPFISFRRCLNALPLLTRPLLTPKKFCAGYVNKSISVCRGDSGGGLVFFDSITDRYYIRGIVSIAFKPFENTEACFSQLYTGFTKFSDFISWIGKKYNQ